MITFKSVGHFFAKAFQAIVKDAPKDIAKVEATQGTVTTVTAAALTATGNAPIATAAVAAEDAAYAALGGLSAIINAADAAKVSKLTDAGLDVVVIQKIEALLKSFPQLVSLVKAL